mgnify:CR=1 FL=1
MAGLGLPPECPRVWGMQVGRLRDGEAKGGEVLDYSDGDAATTALTTDAEFTYDSDTETEDDKAFAAENAPRPPPAPPSGDRTPRCDASR